MHILVVDDDHDTREVFALIFKMSGHTAITAMDGREALACLADQGFDLILLDLVMHGMSGLDFLEAYRGPPSGGHTPIILMTAAPVRLVVPSTCRADAVLQKPFEVTELLALVASVSRVRVS